MALVTQVNNLGYPFRLVIKDSTISHGAAQIAFSNVGGELMIHDMVVENSEFAALVSCGGGNNRTAASAFISNIDVSTSSIVVRNEVEQIKISLISKPLLTHNFFEKLLGYLNNAGNICCYGKQLYGYHKCYRIQHVKYATCFPSGRNRCISISPANQY